MESSTVLAFRIFVMLSCLIVVPMAAIFGSAFPDVVKTVLVDRIVALGTGKPIETASAPADPNGFRQVTSSAPAASAVPGDAPLSSAVSADAAPRWEAPPETPAAWRAEGPTATHAVLPVGGAVSPAGYNQSASFTAPVENRPASPHAGAPQVAAVAGGQGAGLRDLPAHFSGAPASGMPQSPASQVGNPLPVGPPSATVGPPEQTDRFTDMERKLREYGASYYLLETWGNAGELYRFHCRMPVANGGAYSRYFEATDSNALQAMSDVLVQVEAWRRGEVQ